MKNFPIFFLLSCNAFFLLLYPQYAYMYIHIVVCLHWIISHSLTECVRNQKKFVKMLLFSFSYKCLYTYVDVYVSLWNTKHLFLLITIHFLLNHKILWLFVGCFIFFLASSPFSSHESFCFFFAFSIQCIHACNRKD